MATAVAPAQMDIASTEPTETEATAGTTIRFRTFISNHVKAKGYVFQGAAVEMLESYAIRVAKSIAEEAGGLMGTRQTLRGSDVELAARIEFGKTGMSGFRKKFASVMSSLEQRETGNFMSRSGLFLPASRVMTILKGHVKRASRESSVALTTILCLKLDEVIEKMPKDRKIVRSDLEEYV